MKVSFTKQFNKDIASINNKVLASKIKELIHHIEIAQSLREIQDVKKLKGEKNAFRIKIGHYRIGFYLIDETILFTAIDHRQHIYKRFP